MEDQWRGGRPSGARRRRDRDSTMASSWSSSRRHGQKKRREIGEVVVAAGRRRLGWWGRQGGSLAGFSNGNGGRKSRPLVPLSWARPTRVEERMDGPCFGPCPPLHAVSAHDNFGFGAPSSVHHRRRLFGRHIGGEGPSGDEAASGAIATEQGESRPSSLSPIRLTGLPPSAIGEREWTIKSRC